MHTKIFLAPGTSYYSRCVAYGTAWSKTSFFVYLFRRNESLL